MTQVSARAEQPAKSHTPHTYFLAVDDHFELAIAQAWLHAKHPNSAGKVVRELPMHRLPKGAVVIPLTRGEDRTAAYTQEFHGNSVRAVHVPPKDLIGQIREGRPITTDEHWREVRDEFDPFGGELNRDSFLTSLSTQATPCVARIHIGSPNVVRLSFV